MRLKRWFILFNRYLDQVTLRQGILIVAGIFSGFLGLGTAARVWHLAIFLALYLIYAAVFLFLVWWRILGNSRSWVKYMHWGHR